MYDGSRFRGAELVAITAHPLVELLVLETDAGMGHPAAGGETRVVPGGETRVGVTDGWCVAHPLDFVAAGDSPAWQAECFRAEQVQPLKQDFREVYGPAEVVRATDARPYRPDRKT